MHQRSRFLYRAEIFGIFASASLLVLTFFQPQWIEWLFEESPDDEDGTVERWIVVVCATATILLLTYLARREKRKLLIQGSVPQL